MKCVALGRLSAWSKLVHQTGTTGGLSPVLICTCCMPGLWQEESEKCQNNKKNTPLFLADLSWSRPIKNFNRGHKLCYGIENNQNQTKALHHTRILPKSPGCTQIPALKPGHLTKPWQSWSQAVTAVCREGAAEAELFCIHTPGMGLGDGSSNATTLPGNQQAVAPPSAAFVGSEGLTSGTF